MRGRRAGFSLLEVMIALAVIAIALVAAVRTQGQGIRLTREARFTSRAVFMARQALAAAQADPELEPGVKDGRFDEPLDDMAWEREVTPMPGLPDLYRVRVWVHPHGSPPRQGLSLLGFSYREHP